MTTAEKLIACYHKGTITQPHLFLRLACLVPAHDLDAILAQIPAELSDDFERWVFQVPAGGGTLLGSNLTDAEAEQVRRQLAAAIPALKARFTRSAETLKPTGTDAP
jgi:hypothetical protein